MQKPDIKNSTRSSQEEKGEVGKKSEKLASSPLMEKMESENQRLSKKIESQQAAYEASQELDGTFGWQLPGTNAFSVRYWAMMYGVGEKAVCAWITKYKIPYIGAEAKNSFIDLDVFIRCMSQEPANEQAK